MIPSEKPANTRVLLTITPNTLEVKTPPPDRISQIFFHFVPVFICSCPILMMCFALYWAKWEDKPTILLWSLPFWYFGAGVFNAFLSTLSAQPREYQYFLHIDQHQIYLVDTSSSNSQQPASLTSTIHQIELIPESSKIVSRFGEREVDLALAALVIWANQEKYKITAEYGLLTEAELKWLATEIAAWLNLPIIQPASIWR